MVTTAYNARDSGASHRCSGMSWLVTFLCFSRLRQLGKHSVTHLAVDSFSDIAFGNRLGDFEKYLSGCGQVPVKVSWFVSQCWVETRAGQLTAIQHASREQCHQRASLLVTSKRSAVTQTFPSSGLRARFRAHTLHLAQVPLQRSDTERVLGSRTKSDRNRPPRPIVRSASRDRRPPSEGIQRKTVVADALEYGPSVRCGLRTSIRAANPPAVSL